MINKNVYELTKEGKLKLEEELTYLRDVARPQNVESIKDARAQGDLSENADYDAARDEQARIEARIKEIEVILKNGKLIEETADDSKVVTGKTVEIKFISNKNKVRKYKVVGTIEADPFNNKISNDSPLGKSILGKKQGDKIIYRSETGKEIRIQVLSVD